MQLARGDCWDETEALLEHPMHVSYTWCSLTEQKVDQMAAELSSKLMSMENTAVQYKR